MDSDEGRFEVLLIGGGTGAPNLLAALERRRPGTRLAAVLPVTDSGRSTGAARVLFDMPAPGDLRHCLSTLAGDDSPWSRILEQRLAAPEDSALAGMAVGNIILAALTQSEGDIGLATKRLAHLLAVRPTILPVSIEDVHLRAVLADGSVVDGELAIRLPGKPPISRLALPVQGEGVWGKTRACLESSDWIVLGPGSLWTSLGAVLAVEGVRSGIAASQARTIFVCNTTTQPGQTDGLSFRDHVEIATRLLGRGLDFVIANTRRLEGPLAEELTANGLEPVLPRPEDEAALAKAGTRLITGDLLGRKTLGSSLWQKLPTAYHDMDAVASLIWELSEEDAG